MRPSLRSPKIRNARHLPPKSKHPPLPNWPTNYPHLRFLETSPNPHRPILSYLLFSSAIPLRSNPPNLRLRVQLPHPKISPIPIHRAPHSLHISGCTWRALDSELFGGVQGGTGVVGGGVGAEFFMVGGGGGTICLYSEE